MDIPLSLYIHMPWCLKKCPYCDFNSHVLRQNELPEKNYIQALLFDLEKEYASVQGRSLTSIFAGGGTPSLITPDAYDALFTGIKDFFSWEPDVEITLEANPGAIEHPAFERLKQVGFTRLSLGIQSFQETHLKQLGRIHSAQEAKEAVYSAQKAGFDNINLDIMYGLPNQTLEEAMSDLKEMLGLAPQHFSWYQLTLEPNTAFFKHPPPLPTDEITWQMQSEGQAFLAEAGYEQYEISAYAREQRYCQHNLNYWKFGDYLGIGAGAHGKVTCLETGQITRRAKLKSPGAYLKALLNGDSGLEESREVLQEEQAFEFMLNALRLTQPIPWKLLEERTALFQHHVEKPLAIAQAKGLIEIQNHQFIKTDLGTRFLNDLIELFLPHNTVRTNA